MKTPFEISPHTGRPMPDIGKIAPVLIFTSLALIVSLQVGVPNAFGAETTPLVTTAPPSPNPQLVAPVLSCLGQTFLLAQSTGSPLVETHEYVLDGENSKNWTQMVTVQRLTLPQVARPTDFLVFSEQRLRREGGATVLTQPAGQRSGIFTAHFPRTEEQEEQIVLCLVFTEPDQPGRLHVLHYAIKPSRVPSAQFEAHLRAWRQRFQSQAGQMEQAGRAGGSPRNDL